MPRARPLKHGLHIGSAAPAKEHPEANGGERPCYSWNNGRCHRLRLIVGFCMCVPSKGARGITKHKNATLADSMSTDH